MSARQLAQFFNRPDRAVSDFIPRHGDAYLVSGRKPTM
jgi:hypothetical protein